MYIGARMLGSCEDMCLPTLRHQGALLAGGHCSGQVGVPVPGLEHHLQILQTRLDRGGESLAKLLEDSEKQTREQV